LARRYIAAKLENISLIPWGAVYRGQGIFDFIVRRNEVGRPSNIKTRYSEHDKDFNEMFRREGFITKVTAERRADSEADGTGSRGILKGNRKRLIYQPAVDEVIPNGGVVYRLPVADKIVVDVLARRDFTTAGIVYYDSTVVTPAVYNTETGELITPKVIAQELAEPFIHHFAGWEE
jgi:hypothetical protein